MYSLKTRVPQSYNLIKILLSEGVTPDKIMVLSRFNYILKELKVSAEIKINNKKLLSSIIDNVKIEEKLNVIRELDKLDKLGEDTVKSNLRKYADPNQILTLFKLLEKDLSFFEKNLFEGAKDVKELRDTLKEYGFKTKFSPFLARGLSYYTGNIFEVRVQGKKDSIGGGGRYDKLVGKYLGRNIPAVGISFGLERLTSISKVSVENTNVVLISLNQDKETIKLAQKLRKEGVSCSIFFGKPSNALDFANSYKISYAIFIGQEEVKLKKFKLKNMDSGNEKLFSEKQIITKLKK